ncbi:MAG: type II toxin-antitoxin system HicB family antitoxin [Magnetococcus sp. YQC-5]
MMDHETIEPIITTNHKKEVMMHNEFTAIIERDESWFIGYCPEIPGANGQGITEEECKSNLADAITLILQDRREDALREISSSAQTRLMVVEA